MSKKREPYQRRQRQGKAQILVYVPDDNWVEVYDTLPSLSEAARVFGTSRYNLAHAIVWGDTWEGYKFDLHADSVISYEDLIAQYKFNAPDEKKPPSWGGGG